jgi:hypothetical protein
MYQVKKSFLVAITLLISAALLAQTTPTTTPKSKKDAKRERVNALMKMEEEGELVFRKQSIFGFKAVTDGYGISYEIGKFRSNRNAFVLQFELNERKNKKETKVSGDFNGFQFNSFVPGKENNFFQFKVGAGSQRIIGGKGNKNGVAVALVYAGGLSLGLLKPYYVDVQSSGPNGQRFRSTYPTIYDSGYHELGASGFTVGWGEVKLKPGVHAKTALRFDYGRFNETVTALEVGMNAEYYPQEIQQIFGSTPQHFFFNAYLTLLLGKRK